MGLMSLAQVFICFDAVGVIVSQFRHQYDQGNLFNEYLVQFFGLVFVMKLDVLLPKQKSYLLLFIFLKD